MSITTPEELAGMRAAGAIVRCMLHAMKAAVRPGVTTAELDQIGARVMREHGARSAPQLVYQFPGASTKPQKSKLSSTHGRIGPSPGPKPSATMSAAEPTKIARSRTPGKRRT